MMQKLSAARTTLTTHGSGKGSELFVLYSFTALVLLIMSVCWGLDKLFTQLSAAGII